MITDAYLKKNSDGSLQNYTDSDRIRVEKPSKVLIHTQNLPVKSGPTSVSAKYTSGMSPDFNERNARNSIIVPVSSTNTVKLASIPGEQSHTNITDGSHTE
jgi:hypothetical protein